MTWGAGGEKSASSGQVREEREKPNDKDTVREEADKLESKCKEEKEEQ